MAKFIEKSDAKESDKSLKIKEHNPNDLIIIYRKSKTEIESIRGWENQAFYDSKNNLHYKVSWVIDRIGNISEIENKNLSVAVIYRGATVGNISIDYNSPYDPGPFTTSAISPITCPDFQLSSSVERHIAISQSDKFFNNTVVEFTMNSNGYFNKSTGGHMAMVSRCDTDILASAVRGQGMIFGNVALATDTSGNPDYGPNQLTPSTQIESWLNGLSTTRAQYLLNGNPRPPILRDLVDYQIRFESFISDDRVNQTLRYTVSEREQIIYDSGVVVDPNRYFNPSKNGLAFGHVFSSPDSNWSVKFSNIKLYSY